MGLKKKIHNFRNPQLFIKHNFFNFIAHCDKTQGEANPCLDVNANEAEQMVDCPHPRAGFTWDHVQKQCIVAPEAGCSKTTNKFIHDDKCHESMFNQKKGGIFKNFVKKFFLQIFLKKFQNAIQTFCQLKML